MTVPAAGTRRPSRGLRSLALAIAAAIALPILPVAAQAAPASAATGDAADRRLTWIGDGPLAMLGTAISSDVCDVNGDGIDDIVVSSWLWSGKDRERSGAFYVILGDRSLQGGTLADAQLDSSRVVRISGPEAESEVGLSVNCLGDTNGDRIDDIAVGSDTTKRVFVVFGAREFAPLDLADLGSRGYVIDGESSAGSFGHRVSAVGDTDGDGLADIAVSALDTGSLGRTNNGRVWVIAGRAGSADVDLDAPADVAERVLLRVDGAANSDRLTEISSIGDFNGDGRSDVLIASQWQRVGTGANAGRAFVIWGGGARDVDLASLGTAGIVIDGPARGRDRFGISASRAGDVNGDGLADLLLGAQELLRARGVAVVFGAAADASRIRTDPTLADGAVYTCTGEAAQAAGACPAGTEKVTRGYWIAGAKNGDLTGADIAALGDVDGDGTPDFVISAKGYDSPAAGGGVLTDSGAIWVVHGKRDSRTQQLGDPQTGSADRIDGSVAGEGTGTAVGMVGDVDGNGTPDIAYASNLVSRPVEAPQNGNGELNVHLAGELLTNVELEAPATAAAGDDLRLQARVSAVAGGGAPVATGQVRFLRDGAVVPGCGAVEPDADGGANCTVRPETFAATASFTAEYLGASGSFASSESGPSEVAVTDGTGSTITETSPARPRIGDTVRVVASVAGDHGGVVDRGAVAFTENGVVIPGCERVDVSGGTAACAFTAAQPGQRSIAADFRDPDQVLGASSATAQLDVRKSVPVVTVSRRSPVRYGETFRVRASVRAGEVPATGRVQLRLGGRTLASAPLSAGVAELRVPGTAVRPGTARLTVAYAGSARAEAATGTVAVTVAKARPKLAVAPAAKRIRAGKRAAAVVTVSPRAFAATGRIVVRVSGKVVRTVRLSSSDHGRVRVVLPAMRSGKRTVTVRYAGDSRLQQAQASRVIRVR